MSQLLDAINEYEHATHDAQRYDDLDIDVDHMLCELNQEE